MEFPLLIRVNPYNSSPPIDSPYRTAISGAVLKLQEEGKLHILKTRWWKEKRGGGSCRVIRIWHIIRPFISSPDRQRDKKDIQCSSSACLAFAFLSFTGRNLQVEFHGERVGTGQCGRRIRGVDGWNGRCLCDRSLRVCVEVTESGGGGEGEWNLGFKRGEEKGILWNSCLLELAFVSSRFLIVFSFLPSRTTENPKLGPTKRRSERGLLHWTDEE